MADINALNEAEGLPEINTGIALNTGDVIAGNIGSERRSKYGFVGHPMNVTSRIEDMTAGGEILVSDSTLQACRAISGRDQPGAERQGYRSSLISGSTRSRRRRRHERDDQPILLVEDNELNRDMLIRRLNRAGLEVIAAGDGQQALDLMLSEQPAWC